MHRIEVSDLTIEVVRKNIKNIHLSVYPPNGRVRIATPININDETIRLFIISKLSWIKQRQRQFNIQERQSSRAYLTRESHYFEGKKYLLRITEHDAPPKITITTKKYIDMFVRANTTTEQRQIILNEWYRKQLKNKIPPIIEKWVNIIGVTVSEWQIKQMKTKWGTCTVEDKRIWLNLELAKKPLHCLEYVIVHEMVHLLERSHNERFIAYMDKFLPQWQHYRDELNRLPISHIDWNE